MASLIGYGAHGGDIAAIWVKVRPGNRLNIYDDDPNGETPNPPANLKGRILIGINNPTERRIVAERFPANKGCHPLVDPAAVVDADVKLGRGSVIAPTASVLRCTTLKEHVHVNTHASLIRCFIGAYSTISPGATICGNVRIGEECWIGAGAIICDRVTIGNGVIIGAGAIVPPLSKVPDGAKVVGVFKQ